MAAGAGAGIFFSAAMAARGTLAIHARSSARTAKSSRSITGPASLKRSGPSKLRSGTPVTREIKGDAAVEAKVFAAVSIPAPPVRYINEKEEQTLLGENY